IQLDGVERIWLGSTAFWSAGYGVFPLIRFQADHAEFATPDLRAANAQLQSSTRLARLLLRRDVSHQLVLGLLRACSQLPAAFLQGVFEFPDFFRRDDDLQHFNPRASFELDDLVFFRSGMHILFAIADLIAIDHRRDPIRINIDEVHDAVQPAVVFHSELLSAYELAAGVNGSEYASAVFHQNSDLQAVSAEGGAGGDAFANLSVLFLALFFRFSS